MGKEYLRNRVKKYCELHAVKPLTACEESGAGRSFWTDLKSEDYLSFIEKLQLLSKYFKVTVSQLLGEAGPMSLILPDQPYLVMRYNRLSKKSQEEVMTLVESLAAQEE